MFNLTPLHDQTLLNLKMSLHQNRDISIPLPVSALMKKFLQCSSPFLSIIRSWEGSYHVVQGVVPSWGDQECDACLAVVQMDQSEAVANLHLVEDLVLGLIHQV